MKRLWIGIPLVLMALTLAGQAIDRDAHMINTVSADFMELDDVDGAGVSLWGETLLAPEREDWAILFGGGFGTISPDSISSISPVDGSVVETNVRDIDTWTLGIGLKFYLAPVTSISAVGTYTELDQDNDERENKGVTFTAKQRFAPASETLSPFAKGSLAIRERSTFSDAGRRGSFSENVVSLGGGIEFGSVEGNFSFVFEAAVVESDNSRDGTEDMDGWTGSFAMQYYYPQK